METKELVVVSGKGGTGKTSLVGGLASLVENKVLCDADVDAANLHLLLKPKIIDQHDFYSGRTARIDKQRCTECGECIDLCRYQAIDPEYNVNPLWCEGCGVCVHFCPVDAIDFPENRCGEWYFSETRFGPMVHAQLGIAEENSGKLVSLVRKEARELAEKKGHRWIITDGPPGIGCPVIASIGNADAVLVVCEPTVSGQHDLERVVELAKYFKLPAYVCVNKSDIYWSMAQEIENWCRNGGARFLAHLPFDPTVTEAQEQGKTIVEYGSCQLGRHMEALWRQLREQME